MSNFDVIVNAEVINLGNPCDWRAGNNWPTSIGTILTMVLLWEMWTGTRLLHNK